MIHRGHRRLPRPEVDSSCALGRKPTSQAGQLPRLAVARWPRLRYDPRMLSWFMRVSVSSMLALGCAPLAACGGPTKPAKSANQKKRAVDNKAAQALLKEAREAARAGEVDAANQKYRRAFRTNGDMDILEEHVDFLIHANLPTEAEKVAKEFYDANISETRAYHIYCEALIATGKGKTALEIADQLIGLEENNALAHKQRGQALILLNRRPEGVEELRRAAQIEDKNPDYLIALGEALAKSGRVDEAALQFRAALSQTPDDALVNALLGMALREQGEFDESRQFLDRAIEIDPENARAYFELGLLLNAQSKQAEAQAALQRAVDLAPRDSTFWYALGEICRVEEKYDAAIAAYSKSVEIDPPHPKAASKLGRIHTDRKEYDLAVNVLTTAIRKDPDNTLNYFELGETYAVQRRNRSAMEAYQKVVDIATKNDPLRSKASEAIIRLKKQK
jgi:tetratricopeptide (TPR) repeat protein